LHDLGEARDRVNHKEERIQQLESIIEQLSERGPRYESGIVEGEGSETEQQENSTGGDQAQEVTPQISELHSPRALAAASEALRNDLDERGEFWVEHIKVIESEFKLAFGSLD
jgi:hypothetical protein